MSKLLTKLQNEVLTVLGLQEFIFASVNLMEGGVLSAVEFAVGQDCTVSDIGGNEVPAPDGSHKVETGEVYVTKGGKIVEIKKDAPVDNGAKLPADKKQETMSEQKIEVKAEDVKIEELAAPVAEAPAAEAPKEDAPLNEAKVKELIMAAIEPLLAKIAELEGGAEEMTTQVEKFAKAPATTTIKKNVEMSAKEKHNSKIEELSAFLRK